MSSIRMETLLQLTRSNWFSGFSMNQRRFIQVLNARTIGVDLCKGQGVRWDKIGNDFLCQTKARHCNLKLLAAMQEQLCRLHQSTRFTHNNSRIVQNSSYRGQDALTRMPSSLLKTLLQPTRKNWFSGFSMNQRRFQHVLNARMNDVDLCKGQGVRWDKIVKDYLGGNSSIKAGHCDLKLLAAMQEQLCPLHQSTRGQDALTRMSSSVMKTLLQPTRKNWFSGFSINQRRFQHVLNARMIDVDLCKGQGVRVWDKNGKEYLDFLGQNGSINAGHCHPKLLAAMQEQMCLLHQSTRFTHNNVTPEFCHCICQMFNYDRVMALNTGAEAIEFAVKMARLWGYKIKKICPKEAIIVFTKGNYWGVSLCACSSSTDPIIFNGFQPLLTGLKMIPFDDPCSLEEVLKHPNVCAFVVEPIQSEIGVMVPLDGYLAEVRRLCTQAKVLWIADETMVGIGRTGYMLAVDHECVKPDMLCLGKSLAGGMYPMSATLASCEVMDLLQAGSHYSTFGANPLGCRVASTMLKMTREDLLPENAAQMGALFRDGLLCSLNKDDMPLLRGRGLLWACQIDPRIGLPCEICDNLRDCGLLVWPCRDKYIRFSPPLIISEDEVTQAISIFKKVIDFMKGCGRIC